MPSAVPKKACILYGFTEGPWHGQRMRRALKKRGWDVVDTPTAADLVIAHSGGVFFIPPPAPSQYILLIDPTTVVPKPSIRYVCRFVAWEVRHTLFSHEAANWLWRMLHNAYYAVVDLSRTKQIVSHARNPNIAAVMRHPHTVITQSSNQTWFDEKNIRRLVGTDMPRLHFLQTHHDDCWNHPERYLALIDH